MGRLRRRKRGGGHPGDRPQRWRSSCITSGIIMLILPTLICLSASSHGVLVVGILLYIPAIFDFVSAKRGWRINYNLSSTY